MGKMRKRLVLGPKTKTYQNSLNHVWPIAQSCHFGQVASFTTVELTCTMPLELVSVFKTHSTQPQVLRLCRCKETRVKRALQDRHNMINMYLMIFDVFPTHGNSPRMLWNISGQVLFGTTASIQSARTETGEQKIPATNGAAIWVAPSQAPSHVGSTSTVARSHTLRWYTEAHFPKPGWLWQKSISPKTSPRFTTSRHGEAFDTFKAVT